MTTRAYPKTLSLQVPPVTPVQLALFAAASGDHNPLHLDPEVARKAGYDRPLVHGMLSMALAGRLFTDALGPGCVRVLQTRFSGVALAGEPMELQATLDKVEGGRAYYGVRGRTVQGAEILSGSAELVA